MDAALAHAATGVMAMWLPLLLLATASGNNCPADFRAFWRRFAVDPVFQQVHLAPVLDESWMENVDPVPREVRGRRRLQAKDFPLELPRPAHIRIAAAGRSRMVVTATQPDTDYQIRLTFRRQPPCWLLVQRYDDSL